MSRANLSISVVVPVYNGADTVATMLEKTKLILDTISQNYEIIIVNDGSSDNTLEVLREEEQLDLRIRVLSYMPNMGKGHAVKRGIMESIGDIVIFIDGDTELSPGAIKECIREIGNCDLAIGSRRHPLSKLDNTSLDRSLSRKLLSRMFNLFLRITVGIKIKDTQAGLKAARGPFLRKIFSVMKVNRFAFDVELVSIVAALDFEINELPIEIHQNPNHKFKIREIAKMFIDVLGISYRLRMKRWYQQKLKDEEKYEYLINPQIAKIESTRDFIPYFSFGETLQPYSGSSSSKFNISFEVIKDFSYPTNNTQKFHFYRGHYGKEEVYYERPSGLGIILKLHVKNILGNAEIKINDVYYKFVRFKADNVYPPGVHLVDIISINLLQRGYCPIHCAAISSGNEGTLLAAPPDTGKTLTTLLALKRGFHFLAEDIAFVDQDHIYANPRTSTFVHNDEFGNSKVNHSLYSLSKKIPLLAYYVRPKISLSDIMKNFKIDEKALIKNIFILDRGEKSVEKIDTEEAMRRILIINRNEFSYYKNPLLFAYSYFNPTLSLNNLLGMEEKIIRTIINKTDCFLLKTNDPKEYIELILKATK